jgi:hypothetical protein
MAPVVKSFALAAAVTAYLLNNIYGYSYFIALPLFIVYFLTWGGYRVLIYQRLLNPLRNVPGPKVFLATSYVGTLVAWTIPRYPSRGTWPGTLEMDARIP